MIRTMQIAAALAALSLGASVGAQQRGPTDEAFKATGKSCDQIEWQPSVLEQYPNIAEACQDVVQRDGRTYVKFVGFAENIDARGDRGTVTMRFEGSDTRLRLEVPPNVGFYVQGRRVPLKEVAPRQTLTLYVPSDQFVAAFFDEKARGEVQTAKIVPLPESATTQAAPPPARVAQAEPPREETLPATAGPLPWIASLGGLLMLAGAGLTLRRLRGG